MSKRPPHDARPATALSAYLSLREAVRPAIVAHSLLAAEQDRAGALVKECESLLATTRELLRTAALVHLLSPEAGESIGEDVGGDRRAQLLDAYADAGMLWARIVGSCTALAGALTEQERWDDIESLATFLESAGEEKASADFRKRSRDAAVGRARKSIGNFRDDMAKNEIRAAIETLLQIRALTDGDTLVIIADGLTPIVRSMSRLHQPSNGYSSYYRVLYQGCQAAAAVAHLQNIADEFRAFY